MGFNINLRKAFNTIINSLRLDHQTCAQARGEKHAQQALTDVYDHYTLRNVFPYDNYDPDTQLFINKTSVGWGLQCQPATGCDESFIDIMTSVLTDVLPTGCDVQFLHWGSPHIGPLLDAAYQNSAQRGGQFADVATYQRDHLSQGAYQSLLGSQDYHLRDIQLYLFVSVPKTHRAATPGSLKQLREDSLSSLSSLSLLAQPVNVEGLLMLLRSICVPRGTLYPEHTPWNVYDPLAHQITPVDQTLTITPHGLSIHNESGDYGVRCWQVTQYPKTMAQWQMQEVIGQLLNPALQIPCPYVFSLNVHLLDKTQAQQRAQRKLLRRDSKAKHSQWLTWLPSLQREVHDWQWVRERLNDGDRLVQTNFQIVLIDRDERLARAERKLNDLFHANGWALARMTYLQLPGFLAMLPMLMSEGLYHDLRHFGRLTTMTACNAVNIAPLQGEWKGYPKPLLILPGRRGQVCGWNPFANDQGNYNIAIAAGSGKGKSAFVQYYLTALLGNQGRCWVIDMGHSYQKTCQRLGGEFIELSVEAPRCLNLFTGIQTEAAFKAQLPLLVPLVAMMARQKTETTEEEDKFIEHAITDAWLEHNENATITTVKACLESYQHPIANNLAHLLLSYAKGGMYADFFEGPCDIAFDNPFIVLELLGLKNKKTLRQVVLLALMTRIHQAMYFSDRSQCKTCIIDEAWDLFGDDAAQAARFIEAGFRTARRHFANFVTITQSINDYYQNNTARAAFMNADFTIVLGQKAQDIEQLEKDDRFPVDGYVKRLLQSLRMVDKAYSECLIQSPHGMSVHRIVLAPYLRVLFSSKGQEYEAVKRLQQQGLSLHDAVLKVSQAEENIS